MHFSLLAMLLEDCPQKKTFAYFRGHISKGELVQMTTSDKWIVAYSDPPVLIDCRMDQLKFVKPLFVQYLLAVENLVSRYNIFINYSNTLAKNVLLDVGDKVDVILEHQIIPTAAVVRYKGDLPRKSGTFFGIEILVSSYNCVCMYFKLCK